MQGEIAAFVMTPKRSQAAQFLGQGTSIDSVCRALDVNPVTIWRWQKQPVFQSAVEAEAQRIRDAIHAEGIANKQNRIDAYNDRWRRMQTVIDERGADPAMQDIPGGKTGLLVRRTKQIGSGRDAMYVEEYEVDTGTLAEMRATEKQAAQELEQWVEKPGAVRDDHITVEIIHVETANPATSAAPGATARDIGDVSVQRGLLRAPLGQDDAG